MNGQFHPRFYGRIGPGLLAVLLAWAAWLPGAAAAQRLPGTLVSWGNQVMPLAPPGTIFKAIAGGTDHSLALRQDGTVYAWGGSWAATAPEGLSGVVAIAAGCDFSLALRQDGTVVAWGSGSATNLPSGLSNVIAIAAGDYHSLALRNDGMVVAWGVGSYPNMPSPVSVPSGLTGVVAIAAGGSQSLALKQDGTVVAWGATQDGPPALNFVPVYPATVPDGLSNVVAIAAGGEAGLALRQDGTVAMWDHQNYTPSAAQGAVAIAAGAYHALALRADGSVMGWATSMSIYQYNYGQLTQPTGVSGITAIATGAYHSLALKQDGTIVGWGNGACGQATTPGLGGLIAVATAGTHTVALKQDGTTLGWGYVYSSTGVQPETGAGLSGVTAVAVGQDHSLALMQDGTVVEWGNLWVKDPQGNWDPIVPPDGLSNVVAIAAGGNASLALRQDGTVAAWGSDSFGWPYTLPNYWTGVVAIVASDNQWLALKQDGSVLGWYETAGAEEAPAGLAGVVGIAAGAGHSLALEQDGTVVAWGAGQTVQPGTENQGQSIVPEGLTNVIAIAAGGDLSLALKQDATVVAWGANDSGQSTVPGGLPWVLALATDGEHAMALVDFSPPAPVASVSPQTQTVKVGSTVDFSVQADGPPPLSYQWLFDGTNLLSGATNAALSLADVQLSQSGTYCVVVTNLFGAATSAAAMLSVLEPPVLVSGPTNCAAEPGTTVDFAVDVLSAAPLSYQWRFNATNLLAGGTSAVLELTDVQAGQSGAYQVVASNAVGAVTSPPAALTVMAPPSLVATPTNLTVNLGTSPELDAAAVGAAPAYQWLFNGTNLLAGATNAALDLVNVQLSQAGLYSVIVSNPFGAVTSSAAVLTVVGPFVIESTDAALREALAGGGVILFACDGTINLTNQIVIANDTVLDATGHQITIACTNTAPNFPGSGNRAFYVSSNVTFTAINLSISNFCVASPSGPDAYGYGGGILNDGGVLNLRGASFLNNSATPGGGAIASRNGGMLNATNCTFAGNCAGIWGRGAAVSGGAILNEGGQVNLQACVFQGNGADAGYDSDGMGPFDAYGGAIHSEGSLNVSACTFQENGAQGSGGFSVFYPDYGLAGGPGGSGYGGAISGSGSLSITGSTFTGNRAGGGGGGNGQSGFFNSQTGWPVGSASGGNGGNGLGGALYASGTASAVNCTFCGNTGLGGYGGQGGAAWSGTVYLDGRPESVGGPAGANGSGGCGAGSGCGGIALTNCTLAFNMAMAGTDGAQWVEEDLAVLGAGAVNTLVATSASGTNAPGPITVAGSNLGSDAATLKLGPLADNGGPTFTMALLPGSPAIGAADSASAPPTDERGYPRPPGSADIGAYEFGYPPVLEVAQPPAGGVDISVTGRPGQSCRLLASPDLVNWTSVATTSFGPSGVFVFHDPAVAGQTQRFYRLVAP